MHVKKKRIFFNGGKVMDLNYLDFLHFFPLLSN